jgi:hypothetical protein
MFFLGLELHEVHHVKYPDLQVRHMLAKKVDRGQGFDVRHGPRVYRSLEISCCEHEEDLKIYWF